MGRSPCCEKVGLKKGPWTPEEDQKLLAYIEEHGHGSWRALPAKAGLKRCGKSCRLRWSNYLRPDIKRGKISLQEEQTIIQLHALLGNRWSAIATHLPKRTDNEIKNYWNTHLKKRLMKMGIDPVTHKPKSYALGSVDGQSKTAATLSHMAQWESARLEAEARWVRESKFRSISFQQLQPQPQIASSSDPADSASHLLNKTAPPAAPPLCLDVVKTWQGACSKSTKGGPDLESPTSTLSFSNDPINAEGEEEWRGYKERKENSMTSATAVTLGLQDVTFSVEESWSLEPGKVETTNAAVSNFIIDEFTELPLTNADDRNESDRCGDSDNGMKAFSNEKNKNYWNNILNLMNFSFSDSPVF